MEVSVEFNGILSTRGVFLLALAVTVHFRLAWADDAVDVSGGGLGAGVSVDQAASGDVDGSGTVNLQGFRLWTSGEELVLLGKADAGLLVGASPGAAASFDLRAGIHALGAELDGCGPYGGAGLSGAGHTKKGFGSRGRIAWGVDAGMICRVVEEGFLIAGPFVAVGAQGAGSPDGGGVERDGVSAGLFLTESFGDSLLVTTRIAQSLGGGSGQEWSTSSIQATADVRVSERWSLGASLEAIGFSTVTGNGRTVLSATASAAYAF